MNQRGNVNPLLIVSIVLGVLVIGLLVFGIWAYLNYQDHKDNVDAKVNAAVEIAKAQQKDEDEKSFIEREKEPTRELSGPSDLGKVTFKYPKTWSVYIDKEGGNGTYQSYLHPGAVLPATQRNTNAVSVSVEDRKYEETLATFKEAVNRGELKASPIAVLDQTGTRLEGSFSKDVQGAAVLFKVRDKTLKVLVQSNDYLGDFNTIILPSLQFNP